MQLSIHLLMLKLNVVVHLEDAHQGEALSDEFRDLAQIEFRSLHNDALDLLIHDLLCQWLLEFDGLDHALKV